MVQADELEQDGNVNVLDLLPGGASPSATERYVAFIVLGALAFLILIRRGFPRAR